MIVVTTLAIASSYFMVLENKIYQPYSKVS